MKSFPCFKLRALLYFSPIVKRILVSHYIDAIMTTMVSQITSLTVVYSTVYSDADQRKHQSSASLAFVWGIHRDRWILRTKGQLRGKCFYLMTSSCEPVGYGHMFFLNYASITTVSSFRLLFRLFVFVVTRENVFSQLYIHRMKPGLSLYLCVLLCYDRCWTKNRPFW